MTIDEAIAHARDVADKNRRSAKGVQDNQYLPESMQEVAEKTIQGCIQCAEEHEQLAKWLEELKIFRLNGGSIKKLKTDIRRAFAEKLKAEVKEQGVKGIIYGDGIDSIDTSFDISKMIDKALAEMEGE